MEKVNELHKELLDELNLHIHKSRDSFSYFIEHIYPLSYKKSQIVKAPHTFKWADRIQNNKLTATLSARKHLKSNLMYAWVMWRLFRLKDNERGLYMSYNQKMSSYHTENIKILIQSNPLFQGYKDKTSGVTEIDYEVNGNRFICEPSGILTFNRGWHGEWVVCDDILQDPANELNYGIIDKINRIFMEQVMSLPKEGGELHLVGTAQHSQDLFFKLKTNSGWNWEENKAILNEVDKIVLWNELFSYDRLCQIRNDIGNKAFDREYQCVLKGTKIITKAGFKNIEDIQRGDKVFGNGNFTEVKKTFSNKTNEIINIKLQNPRGIYITSEHPILIISQRNTGRVKTEHEKIREHKGGFYWIPSKHGFDTEWKQAKDIQRGDIICFPKHKQTGNVSISKEALELAGWYVSEGFCNNYTKIDGNSWCLGIAKKQHDIKEYIKELVKKVWGYDARKTNFEVCINNGEICRYYYYTFGNNAYNKKLPEWFFDLTEEQFFTFFESLFKGDGHHKNNYYVYTTNSETLSFQLKTLLRKFNKLVNVTKNGKQFVLRWCDNSSHCWMNNDYFFERVKLVNNIKGDFDVYNLHTEDETYCTENMLVHNCFPAWSEDAYFKRDELLSVVNSNEDKRPGGEWKVGEFVAGLDIGKKAHPSHFTVFMRRNGIYTQFFQVFMDGWDYTKQIEYIKGLIDYFVIDEVRYDATRGEFESFVEQNIINKRIWKPIIFGSKTKFQMAANFSKHVNNKSIKLINNQRMLDSVLSVNNELQAPETEIGHGDAFWSIAMAVYSSPTGGGYISIG